MGTLDRKRRRHDYSMDILDRGDSSRSTNSKSTAEKRSRLGCLTCKSRRKKCPEDFAMHQDLRKERRWGCSICVKRGLECRTSANTRLSEHTNSEQRIAGHIELSTSKPDVHLPKIHDSGPTGGHLQESDTSQFIPTSDSSWLDDFFREFVSLSDPMMHSATLATGTNEGGQEKEKLINLQQEFSGSSDKANEADSIAGAVHSDKENTNRYDRIARSEELEALLEKYGMFCE